MTGEAFRAHVEQFLAPALSKGDVVVPPRASCARPFQGSDEAPAGASWTIPPLARSPASTRRSPRSAPVSSTCRPTHPTSWRAALATLIEQAFAKLKALLRKAAARARDGLWTTIGRLLDALPPAECRNYLENSGYASD